MEPEPKKFFKIVVPNFNNYIYIKKCLDSILNQTFEDYMCIVVDDMSTDNSDKIAEIYAKRHPDRFRFIRLGAKGHEGGARNAGIDFPVDCEYYYFVDSDDYLRDKDCLRRIHDEVSKDNVDVLLFKMVQLENGKFKSVNYPKFDWNSKMLLYTYGSACTKVVKSGLIERFLENCDHAPDTFQWCRILDKSPSVRLMDDVIYVYRRNPTSITRTGRYGKDVPKFYANLLEFSRHMKNPKLVSSVKYRLDKYYDTYPEVRRFGRMQTNTISKGTGAHRKVAVCGYFVNKKYNGTRLFEDWLNNVRKFYLTDSDVHIFVYTDNKDLLRFKSRSVDVIIANDNFSDVGENRLKKIKYLDMLCTMLGGLGFEYVSFFQSNLRLSREVKLEEILPDGFDIAVPMHPNFEGHEKPFQRLYHNEFVKRAKSVTDISNIDTSKFIYLQDGHIVGKYGKFAVLMKRLKSMIELDKKNGVVITGQPFDERYFNYYFNADNADRLKLNALDWRVYNTRGNVDGCKIYQIDKNTSSLFRR